MLSILPKSNNRIPFVLFIICGVFLLSSCTGHTPDSNGKKNFSLTTMSSQDIVSGNKCIKSNFKKIKKGNSVDVTVKKFSGVDTIQTFQLNSASLKLDIVVEAYSGNLKILLCSDNEVLKEIPVNRGVQTIEIPNTTDTLYLKAGGESANYAVSYKYNIDMSSGFFI